MPTSKGSKTARILHDRLLAQLPEVASMPEGEGIILHYANGQELHANCSRRGEAEYLVLAFYLPSQGMGEEQACYELRLDHAAKTDRVTPLQHEQEQPLFRRLAQLGRQRPQHRERVSRSGHSCTNPASAMAVRLATRLTVKQKRVVAAAYISWWAKPKAFPQPH